MVQQFNIKICSFFDRTLVANSDTPTTWIAKKQKKQIAKKILQHLTLLKMQQEPKFK